MTLGNGSDYAGGLIAFNDGTVSNAFATGAVSATYDVGGLIGFNSRLGNA